MSANLKNASKLLRSLSEQTKAKEDFTDTCMMEDKPSELSELSNSQKLLLALAEQKEMEHSRPVHNTLLVCRRQDTVWTMESHSYHSLSKERTVWCHMSEQCCRVEVFWGLFRRIASSLNWELAPLLPNKLQSGEGEMRELIAALCETGRPEHPVKLVFDFGESSPGAAEWHIHFLQSQKVPKLHILQIFGDSDVRWYHSGTTVPISLKNPTLLMDREMIRIFYMARGHSIDEDTLAYLCRVSQRCSHIVYQMEKYLSPGEPLTAQRILMASHNVFQTSSKGKKLFS